MTLKLKVPDLDEVISEANKKGVKPFHISSATGLAHSTVTRYFCGAKASVETVEKIVNYINKQ